MALRFSNCFLRSLILLLTNCLVALVVRTGAYDMRNACLLGLRISRGFGDLLIAEVQSFDVIGVVCRTNREESEFHVFLG